MHHKNDIRDRFVSFLLKDGMTATMLCGKQRLSRLCIFHAGRQHSARDGSVRCHIAGSDTNMFSSMPGKANLAK